jgi:hypothetical protein
MHQKITDKYVRNRDALGNGFPGAYRFLMEIENGAADGIWLSTSSNAHLYKRNAFLSYVRFGNLHHVSQKIVFSPNYHIAIVGGVLDRSCLLFPASISEIVGRHSAPSSKWCVELRDGAFEFSAATPDALFSDLLAWLRKLEVVVV